MWIYEDWKILSNSKLSELGAIWSRPYPSTLIAQEETIKPPQKSEKNSVHRALSLEREYPVRSHVEGGNPRNDNDQGVNSSH